MRKTLASLTLLVSLLPAGVALADERCTVPMTDWQPRAAVFKFAESKGWKLRRIRIDNGCYEVYGRDGAGRRLEVILNPATLEVIAVEDEHDDEDDD